MLISILPLRLYWRRWLITAIVFTLSTFFLISQEPSTNISQWFGLENSTLIKLVFSFLASWLMVGLITKQEPQINLEPIYLIGWIIVFFIAIVLGGIVTNTVLVATQNLIPGIITLFIFSLSCSILISLVEGGPILSYPMTTLLVIICTTIATAIIWLLTQLFLALPNSIKIFVGLVIIVSLTARWVNRFHSEIDAK